MTKKPNGYWRDRATVLKELERILREHQLTSLPSRGELAALGESHIVDAITKHHGGLRAFRDTLGHTQLERPKGSWKDLAYTIAQAKAVMEEHDLHTLPGYTILRRLGQSSLGRAISIHHGGMAAFRKQLGQEPLMRKVGLWQNSAYAIAEANAIKEKHGWTTLPGGETLKKLGHGDFVNAAHTHYGGLSKFRTLLGDPQIRDDSGNNRDLEYVLKQAREIMAKEGTTRLPGRNILQKEYAGFTVAVARHHGGIRHIRELLGETLTTKPSRYWKDWNNVETELRGAITEFGHFPTLQELQKHKYGSLAVAIIKHGGFNGARRKLGYDVNRVDPNALRDIEYIKHEVATITTNHPELNGAFPSAHWLVENGHGSILVGIQKYHGGYTAFRQLMGQPSAQRAMGQWKDLDFTVQEALKAMDAHGWDELPGGWTLGKHKLASLAVAINKYHGGLPAFRETLRAYQGALSQGEKLTTILESYVVGGAQ